MMTGRDPSEPPRRAAADKPSDVSTAAQDAPVIPIARPLLGSAEAEAVARVLATGWVSQGPEVAAFEQEFAQQTGAPFATAVSSCTAALHVALVALGIGAEDDVLTVSHSFIATANAVRYVGARPVFVDVDPINGNIDPGRLAEALTPATRAILVVHQLGMPCDMEAILAVADPRGIPVIEDAACAIGSEIRTDEGWQPIGRPHGAVACFSFHPRKVLTTGDGGMLTTRDAGLDRRFRLLRQHGMSLSDRERHTARTVLTEHYECLGFNYRMTDLQAAVGRVQLQRLGAMVAERRLQAENYLALLKDIRDLGLPEEPSWARSNWQSFCVRLPERVDQRAFMQGMLERGIATRRGVMCSHREPAYAGLRGGGAAGLQNGERLQDHGVMLPLFVGLTLAEQRAVADAVRACMAHAGS
jgi:dTDP-4-amino-4,6-dideoxygalactose transaminase